MKVFTNPNYKPKIKTKTIQYLNDDYTFHLEDLKNLRVEYDEDFRKIFAHFEPIYLQFISELIEINIICGSFKSYKFNGEYEKRDWKIHQIKIGEDVINYLFEWEKRYFEEKNRKE